MFHLQLENGCVKFYKATIFFNNIGNKPHFINMEIHQQFQEKI